MTIWQWKVIRALCQLFLAHLTGETFDSIEARVQYADEINLLEEAVKGRQQ